MSLGCICKSEQNLYFSTQERLEVVFSGRSKILCGAFEKCLASGLQRRAYSVWMMSENENIRAGPRAYGQRRPGNAEEPALGSQQSSGEISSRY